MHSSAAAASTGGKAAGDAAGGVAVAMVEVKTEVFAVANGGLRPWGTPRSRAPFRRAGGDSLCF